MFNVVIFGAPGSGKGTQSGFLVEKYGFVHLSTGDILREEIALGTEIGKQADSIIAAGHFVSDDIIVALLNKKIDANKDAKGFIFDGFPRNVDQAVALDHMLTERNMQVDIMLNISVIEEELIDRLIERGKVSGRKDDNLETIKERIKIYNEKTMPVIAYYEKQQKNSDIHGSGSLEDVHKRAVEAIDKKYNL